MLKKVLTITVLLFVLTALLGCQTVQGLGEDIKWVGKKGAEVVSQ